MKIIEQLPKSRLARTTIVFSAIVVAVGTPLWVLSAASVPNTFVNGEIADADEVNENFAALKDAIEENEARIINLEAAAAGSGNVPVGGIVYSLDNDDAALLAAGYEREPSADLQGLSAATDAFIPAGRLGHSAVWTGQKMIVWGGRLNYNTIDPGTGFPTSVTNTGGIFDPETGVWTAMSTTNAPDPVYVATAVWMGTEMLVLGNGSEGVGPLICGKYNPTSNTWSAMSTSGAPATASEWRGFWTGSKFIVIDNGPAVGGIYNPSSNTWENTPNLTNGVGAPGSGAAVWTGTHVLVAGENDGGLYNPATDTWETTHPNLLAGHADFDFGVWTGTQFIGFWNTLSIGEQLGSIYTLSTDTWQDMPEESLSLAPSNIIAVIWTGTRVLAVGILGMGSGLYDPATDTWSYPPNLTSGFPGYIGGWANEGEPTPHGGASLLWTGSEAIIWGGRTEFSNSTNTGAMYSPAADTWTSTGSDRQRVFAYRKQ